MARRHLRLRSAAVRRHNVALKVFFFLFFSETYCRVHGEESLRRESVPLTFPQSGTRKVLTNVSLTKRKASVTCDRAECCRAELSVPIFFSLSLLQQHNMCTEKLEAVFFFSSLIYKYDPSLPPTAGAQS